MENYNKLTARKGGSFHSPCGLGPVAFSGREGYFWIPVIAPLLGGAACNMFIGKYIPVAKSDTEENDGHPINESLLQDRKK